ncbi:MAG: hypothetical protein DDT21_02415 [Syntrophomonadaceae bacterium]|nr:hypothetical protein [Bacillota bacterium]
MDIETQLRIERLEADIEGVGGRLSAVERWLHGAGDPTRGLVWAAADLARLIQSLTALVHEFQIAQTSTAIALADHERGGHRRGETFGMRVAFEAARATIVLVVGAVLFILVLGVASWIGQVPR